MLTRIHRLRKDEDYKRLVQNSRSYGIGGLKVRVLMNQKDITRIGVVVGVVFSKKAVVRNRIRRQLQEIMRLFLKEGKLRHGMDIMIRPDTRALSLPYEVLRETLKEILKKMRVYADTKSE